MRILIVDDNADFRDSMVQLAELMDITAESAATEDDAKVLLKVKPFPYDAIILDWWLYPDVPGGGKRIIDWLRTDVDSPSLDIPCILLTGMPKSDFKEDGPDEQTLGRNVVLIHKPVDPVAVLTTLRSMTKT